ncbi:unnamed protein product [Withania somnifera]
MGYTCEFCGEQRSIVYCWSDAAYLCLSCDRNVHSANALSQRHSRTLVCERCNSQPAIFRCVEEKVSLCQNCDWMAHASPTTGSKHKRQALSCYTGCPSAVELSTIWKFLLDDPSVGDSTCEQGMRSMSITDRRPGDSQHSQVKDKPQDMSSALDEANELHNLVKSAPLMGSSMPSLDNELHNVELRDGQTNLTWSKVNNCGEKDSNLFDDGPFYDDFNMDEVDLSIENYEELFGVSLDNSDQLFKNEDIDGLFGTDMSDAESSLQGVNAVEMQCNIARSVMSCNTVTSYPLLCKATSSFSFSNLTGRAKAESSRLWSLFNASQGRGIMVSSISLKVQRHQLDGVMPYCATRRRRRLAGKFGKRVRYVSHKERADGRRRVKGWFVKAGDA